MVVSKSVIFADDLTSEEENKIRAAAKVEQDKIISEKPKPVQVEE